VIDTWEKNKGKIGYRVSLFQYPTNEVGYDFVGFSVDFFQILIIGRCTSFGQSNFHHERSDDLFPALQILSASTGNYLTVIMSGYSPLGGAIVDESSFSAVHSRQETGEKSCKTLREIYAT